VWTAAAALRPLTAGIGNRAFAISRTVDACVDSRVGDARLRLRKPCDAALDDYDPGPYLGISEYIVLYPI
jgi:hypothetical protein